MVLDLNLPPDEGDGEVILEDEGEQHHLPAQEGDREDVLDDQGEQHHVHEVNNQDLEPLDLNSSPPEEEEMHPGYIFVITIVLPL